jgi:restriction endonuclease S subunit
VNLNKKGLIIINSTRYNLVKLGDISLIEKGQNLTSTQAIAGDIPVVAGGIAPSITHNAANRDADIISVSASGANAGYVNYWSIPIFATDCNTVKTKNKDVALTKYIYVCLKTLQFNIFSLQEGQAQPHVYEKDLYNVKIPLPPLDIQQQIVAEFDQLEQEEQLIAGKIQEEHEAIDTIVDSCSAASYPQKKLAQIAPYAEGRMAVSELTADTYVGVDNLLQDRRGKVPSNFLPTSGSVAKFEKGDILLSNIRPYLKKIWLADCGGGCSGDVLALHPKSDEAVPQYLYAILSADRFFEYEMQNIGSNVKMPRADKKKVLAYQIPLPPLAKQSEIVLQIERHEREIARLQERLSELGVAKDSVLGKYL